MTQTQSVKVGVVGCGNISDIYLTNAQWLNTIEVVGVTDLRKEMAQAQAEKYGISTVYDSVDAMLADSEIEMIFLLKKIKAVLFGYFFTVSVKN